MVTLRGVDVIVGLIIGVVRVMLVSCLFGGVAWLSVFCLAGFVAFMMSGLLVVCIASCVY